MNRFAHLCGSVKDNKKLEADAMLQQKNERLAKLEKQKKLADRWERIAGDWDEALKASNVRLGQMVVERAFGSMALYHRDQSTVLHSGDVVLEAIGSTIEQRSPADVSWTEVIRAITPDHAVLINRQNRRGSMIEAGMSMFILETEPAGYVLIAANEAEKASNITLVDVKAVGAFGRLTLVGREGDVEEAAAAAMRAIDHVNRNARSL